MYAWIAEMARTRAGLVHQRDEFIARELGIAKDFAHESRARGFARVDRHHSGSTIRML
jgi:hypothetical protein